MSSQNRDELLDAISELQGKREIKFRRLLRICQRYFGKPRIAGSHHIFKTPWPGNRVNLQEGKGGDAKRYQVNQVLSALAKKLEMLNR